MLMKSGERWHCTNPLCRCEVLVESNGAVQGTNPRCTCGSVLKKEYSAPVLKYLDFLYLHEPALTRRFTSED
jgi:hypothetical protein